MKKILLFLSAVLLLSACATVVNLDNRAKSLHLGMSKSQAVRVLGDSYDIELSSRTPDGALEVLHFYSSYSNDYILHFLNGELVEFHKYIPPHQHEVHVIDKNDRPHQDRPQR